MRLTVGPLPPAVYWRRRAVVLGGLLLIVVVLYASCSGSGSGAKQNNAAAKPSATPSASGSAEPEPTVSLLPERTVEPGGGDGGVDASADPAATGATGAAPPPQAPANNGPCTDEEMDIRPVPAKTSVSRGTPMDIRLIVKNAGDRSCARDVGADLQELRIVKGAETVWSSDICGPSRGSDVRTISPGAELVYEVTWNGKSSAECTRGVPSGGVPDPGQYQLLARLGTKHSTPVVLTLA